MSVKRILHVVGRMNRGGVETWLMHVLRDIDRERFRMDFLVGSERPGAYDEEVRSLGSQIIPCPSPSRPLTYARNFKQILCDYGPYDVVHSHVHHFSGYVLRLAQREGVPIRIAHSHSDTSTLQAKASFVRRMYLALTERWIARHSTVGLAASRRAAAALFGPSWDANPRQRVLYCGIDLVPFRAPASRAAVRAELGIPPDAFVVGHVGNFSEQKNHAFLIDVAAEIARRESEMRLLLVGDGPLLSAIERQVVQAGIADRVIFAGVRSDVPRLMLGAMDVFVLPSLYEGLPLVGIEAQAANLPVVLSDVIAEEVDVVQLLVQRLSLSQPASTWAETILAVRNTKPSTTIQRDALSLIEESSFNIACTVKELRGVYAGQA